MVKGATVTSIPLPAVDFTKVFGSLTTTASNLIPLGLGPPAPCCPSLVLTVVASLGLAVGGDGCALPGVFGQGFCGRVDARPVVLTEAWWSWWWPFFLVAVDFVDGGSCRFFINDCLLFEAGGGESVSGEVIHRAGVAAGGEVDLVDRVVTE